MFFVENGLRTIDGVPVLDILGVALKSLEAQVALHQSGMVLRAPSHYPAGWKETLRALFLEG